jgi:hypothetical protein
MRLGGFILFCCFISGAPHAQTSDAGAWFSASLSHKWNKKWSSELETQLRMDQNISRLNRGFEELSLEYRPISWLRFSGHYRATWVNNGNFRSRTFFDLAVKPNLGKISPFYRIRYQNQFSDFNQEDIFGNNNRFIRNKFGINCDLPKKFNASASVDSWYNIASNSRQLENFRYYLGLEKEINKSQSIELGYQIDWEVNQRNPQRSYVIYLGWKHKI